jgi:hypothetical protein
MLRIDPLTENKTVDMDFFNDKDYPKYKKIVEKYLADEGFDLIKLDSEIIIQLAERWWSIRKTAG